MHRYIEAVKAGARRRISPPHRQSVARISEERGNHVVTLFILEESLAVARRGDAGFLEGTRGLECVHLTSTGADRAKPC